MAAQRSSNVFQIKVDGIAAARRRSPAALLEAYVEDEVNLPGRRSSWCSATRCARCSTAGRFEIGKQLTIAVVSEAAAGGHADLRRRDHRRRGRDRARPDAGDRARLRPGPPPAAGHDHRDPPRRDLRRHRRQGRPAPRPAEGRRRHQHGRPRGGRAVEPDRLGVPVHAGRRDRPRGRRRRRQAALARAGRVVGRAPAAATCAATTPASSSPAATCCACGPRSAAPSRSTRSRSAGGTTRPRRRCRARPRRATRRAARRPASARPRSPSSSSGGTLVKADLPVESAEVAQDAADSLVEQLGSAAAELEGVGGRQPGAARRRRP